MVVITPRWPGRPIPESHSRFFGYIGECTVVVVVVKTILAVVGDVDVWPAVVIVVANGDAEPPTLIPDAALSGNVCKRAITVVMQKHGLRRRLFPLQSRHGRAV